MAAMQILALETSTELGSCAFWHDGSVVQRICPQGRPHSETLLPLVKELLAENGATFADLDAIAFGAGPGAFTGLRVACGVAQGLAVAHNLPVVPVVTLEAMAIQAPAPRVLTLLDARMGEVYAACYSCQENVPVLQSPIRVVPPDALSLPEGEWHACGNGLNAYPLLFAKIHDQGWRVSPEIMPLAACVAQLAAPRIARGEGLDAAMVAPLYVRDKVAQTVAERLAQGGKA